MTTRTTVAVLFACCVMTVAGTAGAGGVSLGFHRTYRVMPESLQADTSFDLRLNLIDRIGLRAVYSPVRLGMENMPQRGYAVFPDMRAELILTPVPSRLLGVYFVLGAGIANYADERISFDVGGGFEIGFSRWFVIFAEFRAWLPDPNDAIDAMRDHQTSLALSGQQVESVSEMLGEHYNLSTYEMTVGYRLRY